MAKWVFLNDDFVLEEKALLHFRDLSFQRGYGIFDFFRLVGNEPLFLEDHLERFYLSGERMRLPVPVSRNDLKMSIFELIRRNVLPNSGIRLSLTGGYSEDGFNLARPNLVVSQHLFALPTQEQTQTGIRLISYPYQRQLPSVKSIDYLMAIWLQPLRTDKGADEILYYQHGMISECPRSNFFVVMNDYRIITPVENVLSGITRKKVIALAKKHYTVEERDISLEEIQSAKEAFITSTTKRILPVRQIDEIVLSGTSLGNELLQKFRSAFAC